MIKRKDSLVKIRSLTLLIALITYPTFAQQSDNGPSPADAAKQIVQQIAAGEFDPVEARYTPQMSAALKPGTLATAWANVLMQEGSFNSIASATSAKLQSFDVITVVCKFDKGLIDIQMALDPQGKLAGIHFGPHSEPLPPWTPPPYAKQDSFSEQPLTLVNGKYEMPGVLTMPKGNGPFAAVVLVQGSGPEDQDETVGADKPFADLALGLASRGVAVFRYTKRTFKYHERSSDPPEKLTVDDETMSDARAAVALLAKQSKIDSQRVFLAGHSLGAYLAPRIAAGDAQVAGIVMMAANVEPMEKLLLEQINYILASGPPPTADEQKQVAQVQEAIKKIESPDLKPTDTVSLLGGPMPAGYWLDLRDYHPIEAAEALKIPILIMDGGRDYQVPTATNFEEWKKALSSRKNVTLKFYPALNHLFIAGTGPSLPQEYQKLGHVDEQVIVDIAAWISTGGETPHLGQNR
ncbi:MAG TPA: alpha/beta fold hydrolase [Candidatus Acidoferrales bacterium]|nr:alpha/beta fold hydrolase [Candidatus Acidoferrales bacterium]